MNYLLTVISDKMIIEKIIFSFRDEALKFAEIRRKQGYIVTVKVIEA